MNFLISLVLFYLVSISYQATTEFCTIPHNFHQFHWQSTCVISYAVKLDSKLLDLSIYNIKCNKIGYHEAVLLGQKHNLKSTLPHDVSFMLKTWTDFPEISYHGTKLRYLNKTLACYNMETGLGLEFGQKKPEDGDACEWWFECIRGY